jgi:hypothetical protein
MCPFDHKIRMKDFDVNIVGAKGIFGTKSIFSSKSIFSRTLKVNLKYLELSRNSIFLLILIQPIQNLKRKNLNFYFILCAKNA